MRNGVIEDVGANVTVPADAIVIDGAGHERVPGPHRHGERGADRHGRTAADAATARQAAAAAARRRRRRRQTFATLEEAERAKRADDPAAGLPGGRQPAHVESRAARSWRAPASRPCWRCRRSGIFKGQSALVNVAIPADDPQISTHRRLPQGPRRREVAGGHAHQHGRPRRRPGLSGLAARHRSRSREQGLLDAQWQRDAEAQYTRTGGQGPAAAHRAGARRAEAGARAADAGRRSTPTRRARSIACWRWPPSSTSIRSSSAPPSAAERIAELQKAKARVILSLNFPGGRGGGAGAAAAVAAVDAAVAARARRSPAQGAGGRAEGSGGAGARPACRSRSRQAARTPRRLRPQRRPRGQGRRPRSRRRAARAHDRRRAHRRRGRSRRLARERQDRQPRRHARRSVRRRHGPSRVHRRPAGGSDAAGAGYGTRRPRRWRAKLVEIEHADVRERVDLIVVVPPHRSAGTPKPYADGAASTSVTATSPGRPATSSDINGTPRVKTTNASRCSGQNFRTLAFSGDHGREHGIPPN